jgi:hypothetical protein
MFHVPTKSFHPESLLESWPRLGVVDLLICLKRYQWYQEET